MEKTDVSEPRQLQSPLESVEPFRTPPSLPSNTVNVAGCLVDWMESIDTYLRENQEKLEKLRLRCQTCNCNDPQSAKQETPGKMPEHNAQSSASFNDNTLQTWDKKDEPGAKVKDVNWEQTSWEQTDWEQTNWGQASWEQTDGTELSEFNQEDFELQKGVQASAKWHAMYEDVIREDVTSNVLRFRTHPEAAAEEKRSVELEALVGALRYWEILSGRSIQDTTSARAVTDWLLQASVDETSDQLPPPLINSEATEPVPVVAESSSSHRTSSQVDRDAILKAIESRAGKKVFTPPTKDFLRRHAQIQDSPQPPRSRTLPHTSSTGFQSRYNQAPSQTFKKTSSGGDNTGVDEPDKNDKGGNCKANS